MDCEERENMIIADKKCREENRNSNISICSTGTRLQRNQAEKQRRDKLNGYISELANLVPMVKNSSKPVDKVSVLRLAAAHMRLNLSCLNSKNFKSKITALPSSVISDLELIEKSIGGFVVATTLTGMVLFCSKSIEDYIGYQSINIMGQSIYNFVHSKEVAFFEKKISSAILRSKKEKKANKVIKLHLLQRPLPRSTEVRYRKMIFKLSVHYNETNTQVFDSKSSKKIKKVKHKDFGTSSVILMFIEPMKMQPKINRTYLLTHTDIYFTIHGLQGEIMYADQRIATITGYMPRDVQGISAYKYILDTDVPIALFAQKAMFTSNDGTGLITYRLRICNSTYIYLQSKGQIVYKENTTEMSHFICLNRRLSDEEGKVELMKFQERFAPQISDLNNKDRPEKKLNNKSPIPNTAEQNSEDTLSYLSNSNGPQSVEQVSFPYSGIAPIGMENFIKTGHPENSSISSVNLSISSIQPMNSFSNCKDDRYALIAENHKVQFSLPNSNLSSELGFFDEIQQTTYQNKGSAYLSEPYLVDYQFSNLQNSALNFNQHCIANPSRMSNGDPSLHRTSMSQESVTPQSFNQFTNEKFCYSANVSKFNLKDISLDFNNEKSSLNSIYNADETLQFSKVPNSDRFPISKTSTYAQPYSSIQNSINHFCSGKDTLLNGNSVSVEELSNLRKDGYLSLKANTPQLNDRESVNSDEISKTKVSSFTQSNSSISEPMHIFSSGKDKLMIGSVLDTNELKSMDTIMKPFVKDESTVYSNGLRSIKPTTSRFEKNEFHLVNPTYSISESCLPQKFYSNDTFDGASYHNFGTSYGVHKHCDARSGNSNGASSYSSSTNFSISNDFTNGSHYCTTNSINVSNKGFVTINESNYSEVPIVSKNISASSLNDSFLNSLHSNPAKRVKTEIIPRSAKNFNNDVQQMSYLLKRNDSLDLFPDSVSNNMLDQSKASLSMVAETSTQRDSEDSVLNVELYNELDLFFEKLPLPACSQTQVTCESALSSDLTKKTQLNMPPLSTGLLLD